MLLLQVGVFAQSEVPANVSKAFATKFPSVEAVEWSVGDAYVAVFWVGDFYKEAIFSKNGEWLETTTVLESDALPSEIMTVLNKELGEVYITYVVKMETKNNGDTYIIDLSTDAENLQVTTDTNGKILKKVSLEASTDNDDGF